MTREELNKVIEEHSKWLENYDEGTRADLRFADLTGADLTGADLSGANLYGANLTDADLTDANLTGANLRDADLTNANLKYADLTDADLTWANLTGADLTDANLTGADLYGADLSGADLSGANLKYANLRDADLTGADLRSIIGEMKYLRSMQIDKYMVSYTDTILNIGCQSHTIEEWKNFDDEKISSMDDDALNWWRVWKPIIMNIIEISPALPTRYKTKEK